MQQRGGISGQVIARRRSRQGDLITMPLFENPQRFASRLWFEGEMCPRAVFVEELIVIQAGLFDFLANRKRWTETGADEVHCISEQMCAVRGAADGRGKRRAAIAA